MSSFRGGLTIGGYLALHTGNLLDNILLIDGAGSGINADMIDDRHVDDTKTDTASIWTANKINTELAKLLPSGHSAVKSTTTSLGHIIVGNGLSVDANGNTTVKAGNAMTVDANGVHHSDTSSQASINNTGNSVIQSIVLDGYGHATSIVSKEITASSLNVLPLTGGIIDGGNLVVTTNSGANYFRVGRGSGSSVEYVDHYVTDANYCIKYTNDEFTSQIVWNMINTDIENSDGSRANNRSMTLTSDTTGMILNVGGNVVLTSASMGTGKNLDADMLDGLHATSFIRGDATNTSTIKFGNADGVGINFFNSNVYSIYMSSSVNATFGGNAVGIPTDASGTDYNMYFNMNADNRGFAFRNNTRSKVVTQITGKGDLKVERTISLADNKVIMEYNPTIECLEFKF